MKREERIVKSCGAAFGGLIVLSIPPSFADAKPTSPGEGGILIVGVIHESPEFTIPPPQAVPLPLGKGGFGGVVITGSARYVYCNINGQKL